MTTYYCRLSAFESIFILQTLHLLTFFENDDSKYLFNSEADDEEIKDLE